MSVERTLNELVATSHRIAKEKGFWSERCNVDHFNSNGSTILETCDACGGTNEVLIERNTGELLMLITSELGEALEADRKDRHSFPERMSLYKSYAGSEDLFRREFEEHIKDTFEDEIADAVIRLFDLAAGKNIDLEYHILQKLRYNAGRERRHGKRY